MPLYVVPRTRAWLSEEELAAAADCIPAVNETPARARALDPLLRRVRGRRHVRRLLRLRGDQPGAPARARRGADAPDRRDQARRGDGRRSPGSRAGPRRLSA